MQVGLSINSDVGETLTDQNLWYPATATLVDEFIQRGHDLVLVHPEDLRNGGRGLWSERILRKEGDKVVVHDGGYIKPDLFFIRSLGENTPNPSATAERFLESLAYLERQGVLVCNSSISSGYEDKVSQKKLDLPFIPGFDVSRLEELSDLLLEERNGIIAKPIVGFRARGVLYLRDQGDIAKHFQTDGELGNYLFERFIPDKEERRYIFLDGDIIVSRVMQREGNPGEEVFGKRTFNENADPREVRLVYEAIEQTGMFYGCVDFRGPYILEINGSGTANLSLDRGTFLYDLAPQIVKKLETLS